MTDKMLQELTARLYACPLQNLRRIGGAVGVKQSTTYTKTKLIAEILTIADGTCAPAPRNARGAPPKYQEYDKVLVADIEKCRAYHLALERGEGENNAENISLSDGLSDDGNCMGILERAERSWFIRVNGCRISGRDVAVQDSFITRFNLCEGDFLTGKAVKNADETYVLKSLSSVNGHASDARLEYTAFSALTNVYPRDKLNLGESLSCRIFDFFTPLGAGQRALIYGKPATGKTELLLALGKAVTAENPQLRVVTVLLSARPEEAEECKNSLVGSDVFYTGLEDNFYGHAHCAALALKYCKRLVEGGRSVALIFDGLEKCVQGEDYSGAIKILASAGAYAQNRSFTVIAATQSSNLFDAAGGAANLKVVLSEELAFNMLYPAYDLTKCRSVHPDFLVDSKQISAAARLRAQSCGEENYRKLLQIFQSTAENREIAARYGD